MSLNYISLGKLTKDTFEQYLKAGIPLYILSNEDYIKVVEYNANYTYYKNHTPKFRPYRGAEKQIQEIPYQSGYVYFATDTGRIYLDYEDNRVSMGGSGAALYYATDYEVIKDIDDNYTLNLSALDEPELVSNIKENDLIINIDGAFYRIKSFTTDKSKAICARIAISGSGGSGGGSGEGDNDNRVEVETLDPIPKVYAYGKDYYARIKVISPKDKYVYAEVRTMDNNGNTKNKIYTGLSGEEITINIGELVLLSENFRLEIVGSSDNCLEYIWVQKQCKGYEMYLTEASSFNPLKAYSASTFNFICIPYNAGFSGLINVYIDGSTIPESREYKPVNSGKDFYIPLPNLTHGTHTLRAEMVCNINGFDVYTNELEYEVAIYEPGIDRPLIWCPKGYKKEVEQYDNQLIEFRVWTPAAESNNNATIKAHFYKNNKELGNSPREFTYSPKDLKSYQWSIIDHDVGNNNYKIMVETEVKYITFITKEDKDRDLNIISDNLVLNLNSAGRSNAENFYSKTRWVNSIDNNIAVEFKDFNWYNNGWFTDVEGNSCLRISNGASINIPIASLGITRNKTFDKAISYEFRFKLRNVKEYNSLVTLEERFNPVTQKNEVVEIFSTDKSVVAKLFGASGLCIGTQDAFFKTDQNSVYVKYRENELLTLSIVIDPSSVKFPLIYIYINGILSGITLYNSEDDFTIGDDNIVINSDYCDIDLYNIRIYKDKKLQSHDVVHNYISDRRDLKAYDLNTIVKISNNDIPYIDKGSMERYNENHPDETIMPYMIIKSRSDDNRLPFVKGGKKPVDIDFKNPALDYAYKKGYITLDQYIHGAPSFHFSSKQDSFDVQGTSSQSYPRRNFKWKAKQADASWYYTIDDDKLNGKAIYQLDAENSTEDKQVYKGSEIDGKTYEKYYLDSNIGETTFCLKADYMESSGTHNTGFASFVSTLYDKHPLGYYISGSLKNSESLRTTIYGFPILVFQELGNNNYEFIGRYNFNLDKGATDTCGFTYKGNSKIIDTIDETTGDKIYKPFKEVAECWEFKNNQGARCSFTTLDFEGTSESFREVNNPSSADFIKGIYYIYDPEDQTYKAATEYDPEKYVYYIVVSGTLDWLNDFEYRYSAFDDDIDAAIEKKGQYASMSQENVNKHLNERLSNFIKLATWLNSTNTQDPSILGTEFEEPKVIEDISYTHDTAEYRLAKFRTEFEQHLNLDYCILYFIMTELLHLFDSRGKNCMMASWGPIEEGGEYIWFPIFYDIDTQLGLNNSGVPIWDYYVEPTRDREFSTSNSVLWNNLWACYSDNIKRKYGELRVNSSGKGINISRLNGFYNAHPILDEKGLDSWKDIIEAGDQEKIISYGKIGKRPPMIINADQYHKYINPTLVGYTNTSGDPEAQDGGKHFYCLQGDRAMSRYQYLRNRINYVDSLWGQGDGAYASVQNNFKMRMTANQHLTTSDKYIVGSSVNGMETIEDSLYPMPLDAIADFTGVRSYLKQYNRCYFDQLPTEAVYCDGINPVTIKAPAGLRDEVKKSLTIKQQLIYFGNPDFIADLGDLSSKYTDEVLIGSMKRLTRLQLGSDTPGYYNTNQFDALSFEFGTDNSGEPLYGLLEEVILTGLNSESLHKPVNFSGCEKLKIFRALNTKITGINLPQGTAIQTLHLPSTITSLNLIEPMALTNVISNPGSLETKFNEGLYIDGITVDEPDYTHPIALASYSVIGGKLGYDSYKLLDKLYKFKENATKVNEKKLGINLMGVDWSPYQLVEYGDPYQTINQNYYYYNNDRFELEPYSNYGSWDSDTLNGKVYLLKEEFRKASGELDSDKIPITSLEILDKFIMVYENAINNNNPEYNYYFNSASTETYSYPNITGNIYVHNPVDNPYDEARIITILKKYYPEVNFFFNKVSYSYRSVFVKIDTDGKETIEFTESKSITTSEENLGITYPEGVIPKILNKDFIGWSKDKDANPATGEDIYYPEMENFETEWAKMKYTRGNYSVIKFYAIFAPTIFIASFYNVAPDGTPSKEPLLKMPVEAGTYLSTPDLLPVTDERDLADTERYKFLGWVSDPGYSYPVSKEEGLKRIVTLENIISENADKVFYACYVQENVLEAETDSRYFTFSEYHYKDEYDSSYDISGYWCEPKANAVMAGKITIPGSYNGMPVIGLRRVSNSEITHIYFKNPETIRRLTDIYNNSKMRVFKFPIGLRYIDGTDSQKGFRGNYELKFDAEGFAACRLAIIDSQNCFTKTFKFSEGQIPLLRLPGTIRYLNNYAFMNLSNTVDNKPPQGQYYIEEVSFGGPNDPCYLDLDIINNNALLFKQGALNYPPKDEGANIYTAVKTFTFYRDPASTNPSQDAFEKFVNSDKMLGGPSTSNPNNTLNIQVVDVVI